MSAWISPPPISCAAIEASPSVVPKNPIARARSCSGKVTRTMASTCGLSSAAVSPCSTREAISMAGLSASPQNADAIVNPTMPIMNSRLRP